ncbi:MAG: hypothetical protein FWC79_02455 [Oscillospiraceae bacterium]|nr:hypothetical protein [Oscillospiraceae bacterium]
MKKIKVLGAMLFVMLIVILLTGCETNLSERRRTRQLRNHLRRNYNNVTIYYTGSHRVDTGITRIVSWFSIARADDNFVLATLDIENNNISEKVFTFNDNPYINNRLQNSLYLFYEDGTNSSGNSVFVLEIVLNYNSWDTFNSEYRDILLDIVEYFTPNDNVIRLCVHLSSSTNLYNDYYKTFLIYSAIGQLDNQRNRRWDWEGNSITDNVNLVYNHLNYFRANFGGRDDKSIEENFDSAYIFMRESMKHRQNANQ